METRNKVMKRNEEMENERASKSFRTEPGLPEPIDMRKHTKKGRDVCQTSSM
jgi:hypothetical protein